MSKHLCHIPSLTACYNVRRGRTTSVYEIRVLRSFCGSDYGPDSKQSGRGSSPRMCARCLAAGLDFLSRSFNPLLALHNAGLQPPKPGVLPLDNLYKCRAILPPGDPNARKVLANRANMVRRDGSELVVAQQVCRGSSGWDLLPLGFILPPHSACGALLRECAGYRLTMWTNAACCDICLQRGCLHMRARSLCMNGEGFRHRLRLALLVTFTTHWSKQDLIKP